VAQLARPPHVGQVAAGGQVGLSRERHAKRVWTSGRPTIRSVFCLRLFQTEYQARRVGGE
jgi:hypothetical protein